VQPSHSSERRGGAAIVAALALAIGLAIAYVDSRTTWDDAGITAGALLLSAGVLGATRRKWWWLSGLLVGAPVPIFNYVLHASAQAMVALAFSMVGALVGAGISRSVSGPQRTHTRDTHP